jgi:hypothetical protein
MIENQKQYEVTSTQAQMFADALAADRAELDDMDPLLRDSLIQSLEGTLAELQGQMAEYEARTAKS